MVSLLNSEGPLLRLNRSEVMTQFPNYLYDPYAYPSNLNSMDYHWNLFHPQNHYAIQNKRKKKMKEQVASERVFKDILPSFEYRKEEIIDWLKSLPVEKRLEIFSIQNNWLISIFIKMYKKWSESHNIVFAMLQDNKKTTESQGVFEFNNLETSFYCRRKPTINEMSLQKEQIVEGAEKEIIKNFRIYDSNELYDTIVPTESFVQDIEKLVSLFELISDNLVFTKPCRPSYQHGTKSVVWDSPLWFSPHSFQTFPAWIVSSLERAVWAYYFDEKIGGIKNYNIFSEGRELRINLKYKQDLTDFWKNLEKGKKKKLLSSTTDIHKTLTSEKNKNDKELKDVDQKLKQLFLAFSKPQIATGAETASYFQNLLETVYDDDNIINSILFTPFEDFGNLTNLICRKLTLKLKNMLAERIATDLILNEEKEKITNKKNSKKKKATKKQTKECSSPSKLILEQEELESNEQEKGSHEIDDATISAMTSQEMRHKASEDVCEQSSAHLKEQFVEKYSVITPSTKSITQCEIETPSNQESVRSQESHNNLRTPDKKKKNRKNSFGNDFASSHRPDELSTDHSIEEQKKEFENEAKQDNDFYIRKNSPKRLKSYTCHIQNTKVKEESQERKYKEGQYNTKKQRMRRISSHNISKGDDRMFRGENMKNESHQEINKVIIKNSQDDTYSYNKSSKTNSHKQSLDSDKKGSEVYSNTKNDADTTDSESGILQKEGVCAVEIQTSAGVREREGSNENLDNCHHGSSQDFIEVKSKKKKSVQPIARGKKEQKESLKKRKDRNFFIEKSIDKSNGKNEKEEKSKTVNPPKSFSKVAESKMTEDKVSNSNNTQPKTFTPETSPNQDHSETPAASCPNLIAKTNSPSLESGSTCQKPAIKKPLRLTHKLSLASPSLDFEAIATAKAKNFAKEYFDNKFTKDIYDHVEHLTNQSNHLTNARILVYKRLDHCIAWTFPMYNMKTKIFGSCATGLALETSDVDIAVSGIDTYDRPTLCECLTTISEVLKGFKWVISNKPILTAHVPVLKLEIDPCMAFDEVFDEASEDDRIRDILYNQVSEFNLLEGEEIKTIKVDLTLEGLGMLGYTVHMGYKSTEFAEKMLAKHKSLYIITMVLKEFLFNRQLLNTYQGGVSSYCLIIMVVAMLEKYGDEGFMKSLRRIMKFYGEEFQPEKMGITLSETDPFFPLNHSYETAPLWILDHNNLVERRNVGQGAYSVKVILYEFARVSKIIDLLYERLEELVLQHKYQVHKVEDIELIGDAELKKFIESNILNQLIMC